MFKIIIQLALGALYYWMQEDDARATVASYGQKGAEGNELITKIYHTMNPKLGQIRTFNLLEYAVLFAPLELCSLFLHSANAAALTGGFALAIQIGMPIGSFLAWRKWIGWEKQV